MISPKKLQANRANAQHSTGPKSAAGKARSAGNARRHGLAISVWSDTKLAAHAEALAHAIAGDGATPEAMALAREVAAAQVDLVRVRKVRLEVLAATEWFTGGSPSADAITATDLRSTIETIDRYERRAMSRRKMTIRSLHSAC